MGLDLYAGTLTRYYAGQWETAAARLARHQGIEYRMIRPKPTQDAVTDPAKLEQAAVAWRDALSGALGGNIAAPLRWAEGMGPPYLSDKPDWDGFGGLLLWAAYQENPRLKRPQTYVTSWQDGPALMASGARPDSLLAILRSQLWLPGDGGIVFEAEDLAGATIPMSFTRTLQGVLDHLNALTWSAGPTDQAAWRARGVVGPGQPFEHQAQFGFAVFKACVAFAIAHDLPLKTDF